MHPELIRFSYLGQERAIYSYGALVVLAMAVAIGAAVLRARRYGIEQFDAFAVGILCAVGGVIGGWLLYVGINLGAFLDDPTGFLKQPGMVFYGGFIGAVVAGMLYMWRYRVSMAAMCDVGAPCLPLGHAVGRLGCFFGGCCFGAPTSSRLGVMFTDPRAPASHLCKLAGPIHPVQLYEAAGLVAISLVVWLLSRPLGRRRGTLFPIYMILYAALRLGTEHFRGDHAERKFLIPGLISTSEAIAIGMMALALAVLVYAWRRGPASPKAEAAA